MMSKAEALAAFTAAVAAYHRSFQMWAKLGGDRALLSTLVPHSTKTAAARLSAEQAGASIADLDAAMKAGQR